MQQLKRTPHGRQKATSEPWHPRVPSDGPTQSCDSLWGSQWVSQSSINTTGRHPVSVHVHTCTAIYSGNKHPSPAHANTFRLSKTDTFLCSGTHRCEQTCSQNTDRPSLILLSVTKKRSAATKTQSWCTTGHQHDKNWSGFSNWTEFVFQESRKCK